MLHGLMLASLAVLIGPLLVVPTLAVGSRSIMQLMPTVRSPRVAFGVHILAVGTPLGLEYLGVLPTTFSVRDGGLDLHPWAVHASTTALVAAVLVGFVLQLVVNTVVITRLRARQDEELVRRHVQTWKLGQLVPPHRPA